MHHCVDKTPIGGIRRRSFRCASCGSGGTFVLILPACGCMPSIHQYHCIVEILTAARYAVCNAMCCIEAFRHIFDGGIDVFWLKSCVWGKVSEIEREEWTIQRGEDFGNFRQISEENENGWPFSYGLIRLGVLFPPNFKWSVCMFRLRKVSRQFAVEKYRALW